MKKAFVLWMSFILSILLVFPVLAGTMDLARADGSDLDALEAEVEKGRRIFDQTQTLSSRQAEELQRRLSSLEKKYGQTFAIILVSDQAYGDDLERYCDEVYSGADFDDENNGNGVLLVLDLGEKSRGVQIYAKDGAVRYVTDAARDKVFDSYQGGMMPLLSSGSYYDALILYTDFLDALYARGVQQDQYNYDAETGKVDQAYPKRSFKFWYFIVAAVIAGISAWIPVSSVKKQYALVLEKKQAAAVNLAYRATATLALTGAADAVIGRHVAHIPIPRTGSGGGSNGPSLGGGQSTTHSSVGGGSYSSGGRKF